MKKNHYQYLDSPIGLLRIEASSLGVTQITLEEQKSQVVNPNNHTQNTCIQLREYFNRKRTIFDIKMDLEGYSKYYLSVWNVVKEIPAGKTISYQQIANKINNPKSVRAVGMANGKNPIPIIIPCHRVIGSNGKLTGYALGLDRKSFLLSLENPSSFAQQGSLF